MHHFKSHIDHSLQHLKELSCNPCSLQQLAFWLYEYDDLYKEIKDFSKEPCEQCKEMERMDLPNDCLQKPEYCTKQFNYFKDFYRKIDQCIRLEQYETDCKKALEKYQLIMEDDAQLKQWVIEYFNIGYCKLAGFYFGYLDYSVEPEKEKHLHIANSPNNDFGVIVDREHFENMIEFDEIFTHLYFDRKLYPEKIKEMEEEMSKIVFPMMPIPKIR